VQPSKRTKPSRYVGRFAPSPSGPLHKGSLVTAMASYLDARAHNGRWLLRIEDIDGSLDAFADREILQQLRLLGMRWDADPIWQSQRQALYQRYFERLKQLNRTYGCGCESQQYRHRAYPGRCRNKLSNGTIRTWRFKVNQGLVRFNDRWLGPQKQDVYRSVGDFIIRRADQSWAYQFTVVVDDGLQGITDIVRGADLLSSTARQRQLADALNLPKPRVLHVPLVLDKHGNKLSKQDHADALDCSRPLKTLNHAWVSLGFEALDQVNSVDEFWQQAIQQWACQLNI